MNDAELLQCLERFPKGEPITLYHVDAEGGFVKSLVNSNGRVTLKQKPFNLTTNVEVRGGFKGGKGLEGNIIAFQVDRRFALLLKELSVQQKGAKGFQSGINDLLNAMGDAAEAQKTGQRPAPGKGTVVTFPQTTFEGGGRGAKLPEGHINFTVPVTAERPEWGRMFELSLRRVSRMRMDMTRPPGNQLVVITEWAPVIPGAPKQPRTPTLPPPGEVPNIGRKGEVRLPTAEYLRESRMQGAGWGALMAFGKLNDLLIEHFVDPDQKQRAEADLKLYQDWITQHRLEVPTEGVLVRFYYIQEGSPAGEGVSVVKAPRIYNYLEITFGVNKDEAERKPKPDAISQAGSKFASYPSVDHWTEPLIAPTVADIRTPLKKQALGTFAPGKAKLQQVVCDSFWGFDDQPTFHNIAVPDGLDMQFVVLEMPAEIRWFAGPYAKEPVRIVPPIVVRQAHSGGTLRVVDLDPYLWGNVSAVPVFPANEDTALVFATFPQTIDGNFVLRMKYPNFDKVRWVRPENIALVTPLGDGITPTSIAVAGTKKSFRRPPPPPHPKRPIQWYRPKDSELAPKQQWGGLSPNGPKIYVVGPGDDLNKISQKLYGTPAKWQQIFEANRGKIDPTTHTVYVGQKLALPEVPGPKPPATPAPPPRPFDPALPVS
jgi:hypothetical protein